MEIILFIIAAVAALFGFVLLMVAANERVDVARYFELYTAISTLISAALFGGFGSVISLLKQIVVNTQSIGSFPSTTSPLETDHQDTTVIQQGTLAGYPWRQLSNGTIQTRMDGQIKEFLSFQDFQQYTSIKGPATP